MRRLHKIITGALFLAGGVLGGLGQLVSAEPAPTPPSITTEVNPTPHAVPRPSELAPSGGVMLQKDFPCHEDELLGYHPKFGPDMVGCIHVDEVRNTTW